MAATLGIDEKLLNEALRIGGMKTKEDTVNLALKEFINRRKQSGLIDLFGKMDPDPLYDYKKGRI